MQLKSPTISHIGSIYKGFWLIKGSVSLYYNQGNLASYINMYIHTFSLCIYWT